MKNLFKAKEILSRGHTCVLTNGEDVIVTDERGVAPLLKWLDEEKNFEEYSAADKVIGKAAAYFYVTMGIKKIWASVISKPAAQVFEEYKIEYWYDSIVDAIINRKGDGFCPMESAVMNIDNPEEAIEVIRNKVNSI